MNPADPILKLRTNPEIPVIAGKILVSLMMVCIAVGLVQLVQKITTSWNGGFLIWVTFLISLEAAYTRRLTQEYELREKILFRLSEWIAIALLIKLVIYLSNNLEQILTDLTLWQQNFLNFFPADYLISLLFITLVWSSSRAFAFEIDELYDRDKVKEWDDLGKLQNALHVIHNQMILRVFGLGSLVLLMAVISHIDATIVLRTLGTKISGYNAPVINVLAYFSLGLVLLSQTQFALLRTRWNWQKLSVSHKMPANWLRYSLFFFAFLAIVIFFLPTEYSLGFFDTLRILMQGVFAFLLILIGIILIPFSLCLSLFNFSVGKSPPPQPAPQSMPPVSPTVPSQPVPWMQVLQSLLFWIIFLTVIYLAFRYYISQNTVLWRAISSLPFFNWLRTGWRALRGWFRGANRQVSRMVLDGVKRLRQRRVENPTGIIQRIFNLQRMSPRERVIYYYLNLVELGGQKGLGRRPAQTPYQYQERLTQELPEIDQDVGSLTNEFIEARYSVHPVENPNADQAGNLWERLKNKLKTWKKPGT